MKTSLQRTKKTAKQSAKLDERLMCMWCRWKALDNLFGFRVCEFGDSGVENSIPYFDGFTVTSILQTQVLGAQAGVVQRVNRMFPHSPYE